MLLTNRRHRLIYFCLAGMEIAWLTPIVLLLYAPFRSAPIWQVYSVLLLGLLGWILAIDLANRLILSSPRYELSVLGLIALSTALLIRFVIYADRPLFDLHWIVDLLLALVRFEAGFPVVLLLILLNLFLWFRATNATSRDLDFWSVGLNFRVGMLLLITAGAMLQQRSSQGALPFLWLYFTFGLLAVALARIDEKSIDSRSMGRLLPGDRLLQLILAVGLTVVVMVSLAQLYTPANLRALLIWSGPVWEALGGLVILVFAVIFWIIGPILLWLGELIIQLFSNLDLSGLQSMLDSVRRQLNPGPAPAQNGGLPLAIPPWVWISLRYLGLSLFLLLCLGLVFLFLDRIRPRSLREQSEQEGRETLSLGGNSLKQALGWLKETAALVGQYGLSRQLLAAISIENIYANLCRLARQNGYPRPPAQPPDDYLPTLVGLFVGQEEALARITIAYMRVHYGGQRVNAEELSQIREDYQRIRTVKIS